ncbi:MAG: hypothetical protein IKL16_06605 [Clostridia bacterium]|nr:hypothetical protein [Clostridia bacterium]
MIFPKSKEKSLTPELFRNPTNEYRGEPFWALNNNLDKEKMKKQLDYFEEMGIGGAHMHCRTGLDIDYMSDEYLEHIKAVVERAKEKDMKAYLYDEDRWPSGFAGGLVTSNEEYRARCIAFSPIKKDDIVESNINESQSKGALSKDGVLLAKYDITLENGYLKDYKRLSENEDGENVWYAYLEVSKPSAWFNNQTYVDTLNPEAMKKFVEVTHQRYFDALEEYIGDTVPAIFTDEPQHTRKSSLDFAEDRTTEIIPYTEKLPEIYKEKYGEDFFDTLPEIFWDLPQSKVSLPRYRFHDLASELLASAFADTIGKWCDEHNLPLTGHMMEEQSLNSQTSAIGEAMRSYRSFGLPGIDMLCDQREYTTAKQAQSASHQYGREGVLSELYGVTGWEFDFRGHKQQGDWQAVLGITNRVHHLSWYSMEGEAKRDYPASIFYQSPWYKEYKLIEDHFARVNTAMTRGKPEIKVGLIHPIESYWIRFGPQEQTGLFREELEQNFQNVVLWLLSNQLDFDFIAESLLPSQNKGQSGNKFNVGEMNYDVVIVPALETIRGTTLERLKAFREAGGKVIFLGSAPSYVDAVESNEAMAFADECGIVSFTQASLVKSLEEFKTVYLLDDEGRNAKNLFYQMRNDNDCKWLFIANAVKRQSDLIDETELTIKVKGTFNAELYDTLTGEIYPIATDCKNGFTVIRKLIYSHDSILLRLTESENHSADLSLTEREAAERIYLLGQMEYTMSEPNVALLERAEYSFDDGEWMSEEEVLLIDDKFREVLGYPSRKESVAQPWVIKNDENEAHTLRLRYTIHSEIDTEDDVYFTYERPELCEIKVNGELLKQKYEGFYVDECLVKMNIGKLHKGDNTIEIRMPFVKKTNVEWGYLLGDFGVNVEGEKITITEKRDTICFGEYLRYGMPFYGGNLTYKYKVNVAEGDYRLSCTMFRNPVIAVSVDGKDCGRIAFEPYAVELGHLTAGEHLIEITAFGHRYNSFGAIHNNDLGRKWHGPDAWRVEHEEYTKYYFFKPIGIQKEPVLEKLEEVK